MSDKEPDSVWQIANEFAHDDLIYCVEGTLTKLYPAKPTAHGQLQNGELTDGEGNTVKITFADCTQSMSARNKFIRLECQNSQKHGFTGVKVKDTEGYGRCIWVTPSAQIFYPNGAPAEEPSQGQRPPPRGNIGNAGNNRSPQSAPRQPAPARGNAPRGNSPEAGTPQTRGENQFDAIDRLVSCYLYTQSLVNERVMPTLPTEIDLVRAFEICQRATATVFVDVAKAGIAAKWNPKLKPRQFPPTPSDPHDWKDCYIEKEGSALNGKTLAQISDEELLKLFSYYDDKKSNTQFAECVYQATHDRDILKPVAKKPQPDPEEYEEEDIPF